MMCALTKRFDLRRITKMEFWHEPDGSSTTLPYHESGPSIQTYHAPFSTKCLSRQLWQRPARSRAGLYLFARLSISCWTTVGRIRQSRGVSQIVKFVRSDLSQDASHDLSGAGLRESRRELNDFWFGKRSDFTGDELGQILTERAARFGTRHECDIGIDPLTFNVMGIADNGSLRNSIMEHQRTFYFRRSQSVAGYVNDIVHPACYPIVSVSIPSGAVSCQIKARIAEK